jgi:hypothetical protein
VAQKRLEEMYNGERMRSETSKVDRIGGASNKNKNGQ